tara:strand:- start:98 stop:1801 length:1704 start_codon:yes stop_codon:yes gene_type:complete
MALTQVSTGGIKDGQVHTADLADSQITAGKLHADALDHTYTLGASGTDHYTFTGEGLTGAVNDPTLYLTRGKTYRFVNGNSSGAHPFRIQSVAGAGGSEYNTGVTNNAGAGGSTIIFEVPHDAPDVLYYICTSHAAMNGIFYVTGALADGTVTTAKLADDAVDADKLANSINTAIAANTAKDLTALSASNLTSGTVPDARIGASSVTQHVTPFSDDKIVNDISALALKINGIQNATRYNTNSTSVETFQDANGIATLSGMARDSSGEYIASIIQSLGTDQYWSTTDLDANRIYMVGGDSLSAAAMIDGVTGSLGGGQGTAFYISGPSGYTKGFGYEIGADSDFGVGFKLTGFQFYNFNTYARMKRFRMEIADSGGSGGTFGSSQVVTPTGSANQGNANWNIEATNVSNSYAGMILATPYVVATNTAAFRILFDDYYNNSNINAGVGEIQIKGQKLTSVVNNATGAFTSNVITASSSISSMGGVITYKDSTGTATLNTDLRLFLSADGGSNYTEVTLVAQPDFATGIKMAKANDVTVTAGTSLKYKVAVYNQAAGSKVTQITGVSMQY